MALIGFFFLFLLGLVLINQNLEYQTGQLTEITNTYSGGNLTQSIENLTYSYTTYNDSGFLSSKTFGYWLSLVSMLGFIFVLMGLKGGFRSESL